MKEFFLSLKRTPYQSLAIFLVLFFTLFLSTTLFISLSFFHGILGYVETRPQVTVYFQTNIEESQIFKIKDELINSNKVLNIKYISQKEAFKIYKELNKDNPLLLEMVSAEILPPSLEIYAKKPIFLPEIAEFLKKQPGVDEVVFQKDIVNRLISLTKILRYASFIFFIFLILMTIIILVAVLSFKIALKKDEIHLLRLLGATKTYIRKPFLQEAFIFGLVSAIASFVILLIIIFYFYPFLQSYLRGIPVLTINLNFYQLTVWPINYLFLAISFLISAFFGIIISVFSTFIALNKYLE
ncbi:MAG: permease-like cell division protein FtsX [Patescibacteria group bacterium]|nr:permease-like cell division protein FtsX [Patescibacteria group bacterium]